MTLDRTRFAAANGAAAEGILRTWRSAMQLGEVLEDGMSTRTPFFDRGADNGVFTYEIISAPTTGTTFTVSVLTKNYEDTGNGGAVTGGTGEPDFAQIGSTGFYSVEVSNLKEQVRFALSVTGGPVLYRLLAPTWFDTAEV